MDVYLFSTDLAVIRAAAAGGAAGVVVDWERRGKQARQDGFDTQIGADTPGDLRRVCAGRHARVVCRINAVGVGTPAEVELAMAAGADELLVPMVRGPGELEAVRALAGGRAAVGVMIETAAAVARAKELALMEPARVFVGLNDLLIERGTGTLFTPLANGLIDVLRAAFARVPFGFGGLTLLDRGWPIPARLLAAELVRLRCDFTFLRRSFLRDAPSCGHREAVRRILAGVRELGGAHGAVLDSAHAELVARVGELDARAAA
jgi:hypothetical protein